MWLWLYINVSFVYMYKIVHLSTIHKTAIHRCLHQRCTYCSFIFFAFLLIIIIYLVKLFCSATVPLSDTLGLSWARHVRLTFIDVSKWYWDVNSLYQKMTFPKSSAPVCSGIKNSASALVYIPYLCVLKAAFIVRLLFSQSIIVYRHQSNVENAMRCNDSQGGIICR